MIGRLESGLYTFAEGHIYFSNHVIKIRYDLIDSLQYSTLKESDIFDYYFDIIKLKGIGNKVMLGSPFDSNTMNRFVYIIQDSKNSKPNRVLILPYLHERRVYLQRYKENTEYFCTSMPLEEKYIKLTNKKFH